MEKAVKRTLPAELRRESMPRLHVFPDDVIPQHIMDNVSDQMRQLRTVPKKISDYSEKEIEAFPKVFDWPEDYIIKT